MCKFLTRTYLEMGNNGLSKESIGYINKTVKFCCPQTSLYFLLVSNISINPFLANVPILYPLKTLENLQNSGIFKGCKMRALARNWLMLQSLLLADFFSFRDVNNILKAIWREISLTSDFFPVWSLGKNFLNEHFVKIVPVFLSF